ncbi:MAG TPA: ABC transporter permease [Pyrinomonadaceae bacterium]|nr:ABC transporter permease [Pyrinomonadaceae bacterium]
MTTLIQDTRYGLRSLFRKPSFTLVAIISLALGIGANTAIFTLVNAVLLKPLQFTNSERLVMVWEAAPEIGFPIGDVAVANFADWKAQNQVFDDMAAVKFHSFNITGDGEPEKVQAYGATENFFPLLGVTPVLGRNFLPDEDKAGGPKVMILSYGLWRRRYGGDPNILGRDILLNGQKHAVVGVMPNDFRFLQPYTNVWVPAAFTPEELREREMNNLTVVARLKGGVTAAQAQADIGNITQRIVQNFPDDVSANLKAAVVPLRDQVTGKSRRSLLMLLVAVGLVLLIACANTANLLLSRAAGRRQEIAVRTAVGASRGRIVRQLLTESIILSGLSGLLGLLVASLSFEFLKKLIPAGLVADTLRIDLRVLGYTLLVAILTGILFGLVPALQASRVDLNVALKQGGGRTGLGSVGGRLRGALVVSEVALALVLLVGAGLLVQTLSHLRGQYSFLEPEKLLTVRTVLQGDKYREAGKRWAFYDQVLERVKSLPGVESVGYATSVPLQWKGGANGFIIEGRDPREGVAANAIHRQVSPDYLQTVGMTLREGRYFSGGDNEQTQPGIIINETMARQYWPGESALGKRIQFEEDAPWITIVGVVADVRQMGLDIPVKAEMYLPYRQVKGFVGYKPRDLVIRAAGDPQQLAPAVRREIHAVDSDQPVSNIATMAEVIDGEGQSRRMGMILLVTFAALALLLAVLGIYAVLAFFVTQHRPEIGVRLALGAQTHDILGLVLKKGLKLVLMGVAIGVAGAFALTRLIASLLFGVSPTDPATFAAIALILAGVALLACYIPARRATKVDPLVALRYE